MSFDKHYPRRKNHRKPYRGGKAVDATCRPGGSCLWCQSGRQYRTEKRKPVVEKE